MTDFLHPGQKRFSFKSAESGPAVPSAAKVDIAAGLAGSAEIMSGAREMAEDVGIGCRKTATCAERRDGTRRIEEAQTKK